MPNANNIYKEHAKEEDIVIICTLSLFQRLLKNNYLSICTSSTQSIELKRNNNKAAMTIGEKLKELNKRRSKSMNVLPKAKAKAHNNKNKKRSAKRKRKKERDLRQNLRTVQNKASKANDHSLTIIVRYFDN